MTYFGSDFWSIWFGKRTHGQQTKNQQIVHCSSYKNTKLKKSDRTQMRHAHDRTPRILY